MLKLAANLHLSSVSGSRTVRRMAPRVLLLLLLGLVLAAPALGEGLGDRKHAVYKRIGALQARIAAVGAKEDALAGEISTVTERIRALEGRVGGVATRLGVLERDLALYRERLARLTELFRLQTDRYRFLERQHALAIKRLNSRLVRIYQSESVETLEVVLAAASFSELLESFEYINRVGAQDERIASAVEEAKQESRAALQRTRRTKAVVVSATRATAVRTAQVREARDRLLAEQGQLASARSAKLDAVGDVRRRKADYLSEAASLAEVSEQLAGQIRASQARAQAAASAPEPAQESSGETAHTETPASASTPAPASASSSGLVWPVSGTVTSSFGARWGRIHQGLDIAASSGTPIRAAASGTVISSGWMGAYGNLVVIDHGGGLATAYAHNSSNAVSAGQRVSQGQTIASIGCTGSCTGPHVHFEVRVNGSPVDPLGYL